VWRPSRWPRLSTRGRWPSSRAPCPAMPPCQGDTERGRHLGPSAAGGSRGRSDRPDQAAFEVIGEPQRQRDDGECWIHIACRREHRASRDIEIVHSVERAWDHPTSGWSRCGGTRRPNRPTRSQRADARSACSSRDAGGISVLPGTERHSVQILIAYYSTRAVCCRHWPHVGADNGTSAWGTVSQVSRCSTHVSGLRTRSGRREIDPPKREKRSAGRKRPGSR